MLDIADFVTDRGGNPNAIKESQRRRFAREEDVDEVISLYEEARRGTSLFNPAWIGCVRWSFALQRGMK